MWKIVVPGRVKTEIIRCDTLDELCRLAHKLLKDHDFFKAYCVTGLGFCVYFARRNGVYVGSA